MIVTKQYISPNSDQPLYLVYSDEGFIIQKNNITYKEVIVNTPEEATDFSETLTPIPAPIASAEYVYQNLFNSFTNIPEAEIDRAKPILLKAFRNLDDEDAYLIKFFFEDWQIAKNYVIGDRVLYNKELYNVIQIPSNELPPSENKECFQLTQKPIDLIEEWSQRTYNIGEQVKVGQHVYENLIQDNSWSPQDFPTSWKIIKVEIH